MASIWTRDVGPRVKHMDPEMTWDWWAGHADDAVVTPEGRSALTWAVNTIREFFGENWLAENAAETGFVPLVNHLWWPLTNFRVIVRILELATRIVLVTAGNEDSELVKEAKTIYATRELAGTKFQHLCLTLETAAFAVMAGWSVSYEEAGASGRRPDLTMRRHAATYVVEITILGLDREFRAIDRYCDQLSSQLRGLELEHSVELACRADEILSDTELAAWLDEIAQACQRTAADGRSRTISCRESHADVFAAHQRPAGQIFSGPVVNSEMWRRVGVRIAEKAKQTVGSSSWLRIDDTGALLRLTDRSAQPLDNLLRDLQTNADAALAGAPHVRGIILSGGVMIDPGNSHDETAWGQAGPAMLIAPGPPRHVLADGPAAMSRMLSGGRKRLTFVLPSPHSHLVLPPGVGLEPGLWYHNEASWLTQALQALGHPPLEGLIHH
jgi:hypothetical protein